MRSKAWAHLAVYGVAGFLGIAALGRDSLDGGRVISIGEGRPDLNFVGQFINSGPNSHQFGYLSKIEGIPNVFNSDTSKNESTAMFTFSTQAINAQVINNGPLRVVNRTGTTTVYFHPERGASFSAPSTFEAGLPIQLSDYQQQVLLDPSTVFPFTTVHCASTDRFSAESFSKVPARPSCFTNLIFIALGTAPVSIMILQCGIPAKVPSSTIAQPSITWKGTIDDSCAANPGVNKSAKITMPNFIYPPQRIAREEGSSGWVARKS